MPQTINELRKRIDSQLTQARDALLDWSRGALKAESDDERHQANFVFMLAKETDDLRRRIGDLANGAYPTTHQKDEHTTSGDLGGAKKHHAFISARRRKEDYPKYLRRGNALVKVGLSRDKKSEYEHIVPASEYRRAMTLVANAGANGKEFTADDLLKGFDGPSYRVYVILALLRQKDAVVVLHRGIYKLGNESIDAAIENIWNALPEEAHG
ncbi:MAG: hypothetical protein OXF47_05370 [Nitrospira sp.]|nr:hypothetical protein [Nitrospira sp.]